MLGSRSEPMQSSITACSTGQSANHLHHRGDEGEWGTPRIELLIGAKKFQLGA